MKTPYPTRLRAALLALLLPTALLLSACGDDDKQDDPTPKTFNIKVHVFGTKMASASSDITSIYDFAGVKGKTANGPFFKEAYAAGSLDKTYDLGKFGDYDIVEVTITGKGQSADAMLQADILVDGVIKSTAKIQGASQQSGYCAIETDNL